MSKGTQTSANIVSDDDEGLVKMTGSHKHKAAKSGVSPGNKAKVSPAQPSAETVNASQPVTNNTSAKKLSSPPPETKSRKNVKLVMQLMPVKTVNKKLVMEVTPAKNVEQAQKCKTTVENESLPAKKPHLSKGKSKVKGEPKHESLANKKPKVKAELKDESLASMEVSSQSENEAGSIGSSVYFLY